MNEHNHDERYIERDALGCVLVPLVVMALTAFLGVLVLVFGSNSPDKLHDRIEVLETQVAEQR